MIKPEQVGSYAVLYLTGVECGGVHALQGRAKQPGLIDSVNMRARKRDGKGGAMYWQTAQCIWQRLEGWQSGKWQAGY